MPFVENFDVYLSDFGVAATLNSVAISGIFDNDYADAFGMAGAQPSLTVKTSDAAETVRGVAVVVGGINYTVAEQPEPDGTGITKLKLEKV